MSGIDSKTFRQVLGHYPTGVCIVTANDPAGGKVGMVVGSFTSVSLAPPLVGFLPAKSSSTWPRLQRAGRFCVNVLADDQEELCQVFSRPAEDRFAGISHRVTESGSPILDGVLVSIECKLYAVHEAGDHEFVLGEVEALEIHRKARPLLFFGGGYGQFAPSQIPIQ